MESARSTFQIACGDDVVHVAVLGAGRSVSAAVIDESAREGIDPIGYDDALLAFADLCLLDRLDAGRRDWGLPPRGGVLLVIEGRDQSSECREMGEAVARYLPRASLLRHDPLSEDAPWRLADGRAIAAVPPDGSQGSTPSTPSEESSSERESRNLNAVANDADPGCVVRCDEDPEIASDAPVPSTVEVKPPASEQTCVDSIDLIDSDGPIVTREELAMLLGSDVDLAFHAGEDSR